MTGIGCDLCCSQGVGTALCGWLLSVYLYSRNAQPYEGRPAGGWDVHLGYQIKGGEHIGNVVQAADLGLELVDIVCWLTATCTNIVKLESTSCFTLGFINGQ